MSRDGRRAELIGRQTEGLSRLGMFGAHQGHNCPLQVVECVVPGTFARVENKGSYFQWARALSGLAV